MAIPVVESVCEVDSNTTELLLLQKSLKNTVPVWVRSYNFMSLLNLPSILHEFGSMRNYFEGKYLGERFVQEVKTTRKQCPSTNVTGNLLKKLHEGKALESMGRKRSKHLKTYRLTEAKTSQKRNLIGNVKIYRTQDDVTFVYHANKPISILNICDDRLGILFYSNGSNRGEVKFWEIKKIDSDESIYHGLRYWNWELTNEINILHTQVVNDYAVLLPRTGNESRTGLYTMVTKEWSPKWLDHYHYSMVGMDVKPITPVLKDTAII